MASIELSTLGHHFDAEELAALEAALSEAGSPPLDIDPEAETELLERDLDGDMLADVMDRLDVNDAACDIYLPPDFEGVLESAGMRFGSAHALLLALREFSDELGGDGETDDDDDGGGDDHDGDREYAEDGGSDYEDPSYDLRDEGLLRVTKLLTAGAKACIQTGVAMFLHR